MGWENKELECDWDCHTCTAKQHAKCKFATELCSDGITSHVYNDLTWVHRVLLTLMNENKITAAEALHARGSLLRN